MDKLRKRVQDADGQKTSCGKKAHNEAQETRKVHGGGYEMSET